MKFRSGVVSLSVMAALFTGYQSLTIQSLASEPTATHMRTLITRPVDDNVLVTRSGNVHPAVKWARDLGRMEEDRQLQHLRLQLKRSPEDEAALQAYLDDLHNPKSANFHRWGTAEDFVQKFGLKQADIEVVKNWLTSKGLTVNFVTANMTIDFSGTAEAVGKTFHTEIHYLDADGVRHFANVSDPKIPAALADAVLGPVALHDFKPQMLTTKVTPPVKQYTYNASFQLVVPGDLATIYNYNPLYSAGVSGQGQTVVVLERTDLYNVGDFNTFRKTFGLTKSYAKGKLVTVHPQPVGGPVTAPNGVEFGPEACADPGDVVGDDGEAAVDVEWASASAPNATIELASCADTDTNFGAFIALENLLIAPAPPAVMSLSYGSPESENGTDGNAYINALYQVAVFEGVSLFISTGDADADVTDQNKTAATHGINVNALASTPNDVAVGGTDYGDAFLGENASYWNSTNGPNFNSARSYIPEIPWNDSCASQLIYLAEGFSSAVGPAGFCNSTEAKNDGLLTTAGGSGGPSACATGAPTVTGVVNGTCAGYAKPTFQTLVHGNPADGVRDLPDVSMFAANGVWGHYFVLCYSNPAGGGVPCGSVPSNWAGAGGTSFGAPIWAGIQALINQATGSAQGNPDHVYYQLAGSEYGASGSAPCNSTIGSGTSNNCIFYDVTLGDNDANCLPLGGVEYNCFNAGGTYGVLSLSNTVLEPAYPTSVGYDYATGIGTPNVYNLVFNFPGATIP